MTNPEILKLDQDIEEQLLTAQIGDDVRIIRLIDPAGWRYRAIPGMELRRVGFRGVLTDCFSVGNDEYVCELTRPSDGRVTYALPAEVQKLPPHMGNTKAPS